VSPFRPYGSAAKRRGGKKTMNIKAYSILSIFKSFSKKLINLKAQLLFAIQTFFKRPLWLIISLILWLLKKEADSFNKYTIQSLQVFETLRKSSTLLAISQHGV
jgi:hypothetical protein